MLAPAQLSVSDTAQSCIYGCAVDMTEATLSAILASTSPPMGVAIAEVVTVPDAVLESTVPSTAQDPFGAITKVALEELVTTQDPPVQ